MAANEPDLAPRTDEEIKRPDPDNFLHYLSVFEKGQILTLLSLFSLKDEGRHFVAKYDPREPGPVVRGFESRDLAIGAFLNAEGTSQARGWALRWRGRGMRQAGASGG